MSWSSKLHPFHQAIAALDFEAVKAWLSKDPDVVNLVHHLSTSLNEAIASDNVKMLDLLLEAGANPNACTQDGSLTALHYACLHGTARMIRQLVRQGADIEKEDRMKMTPLLHAAKTRNTQTAQILIELGANVHAIDAKGLGALDHAKLCMKHIGSTEVVDYLENVLSALREKEDLSEAIAAKAPLKSHHAKRVL